MINKFSIGFVWQGVSQRFDMWQDGLKEAMKLLEKKYNVDYIEPTDNLDNYDLLIYWEAPCTINGMNAENYLRVKNHHLPKILLFAGGPINPDWVKGFDEICVESKINVEEFAQYGITVNTAFGINDKLYRPLKVPKTYRGIHHGTCASWKRQWLGAQAFSGGMLLVGRRQETDSYPFTYSKELGAVIKEETFGKELVEDICSAEVLVQSSDFWGGGQRATLEAMACGVPVICMKDSPKNIEYVNESGAGVICDPDPESIKNAHREIMKDYSRMSEQGIEYVKNKWTARHYAYELDNVIKKLCDTQ